MESIRKTLTSYADALTDAVRFLPCPLVQACFFDIETTGLSPQISSLYLLGAAFHDGREWQLVQWFADDYTSEREILLTFADFLTPFSTVIHYNGTTFDIPYLEKKYQTHQIPSPFQDRESLDLYRQLPHKKHLFSLVNEKLTTVEKALGFERQDCFSGKDCIQLYTDFMKMKYAHDERARNRKESLLCHNHDDLIGTVFCCSLLYYIKYRPTDVSSHIENNRLILSAGLHTPAPLPLTYRTDFFSLAYEETEVTVTVPLFTGTLKHFFEDYQNYYYLPEEDTAIHKSVGTFVDASRRKKATASTACIKKTGVFLPLPISFETDQPVFQETRRATSAHYLLLDFQNTLTEEEILRYLTCCLDFLSR